MSVYEEKESYTTSRVGGIGGTDMAAILGLSPWKAPIDVWKGKVDPGSVPELDKECLFWGSALEPIVRQRYALHYETDVLAPSELGTLFPKSRPWRDSTLIVGAEDWMLGAPDGWIPSGNRGLEIKCSARKSAEWGEDESNEIPAHYLVQGAWYAAVTGARGWNYAVLFSGNTLKQYFYERDADLEKNMIDVGRAFWFDYVLKAVEPPVDQTESYGRYLAKKFSLSTGDVIANPTEELLGWARNMKLASAEKNAWEEREREANNHLRALVGPAQKALTPLGTIGWVRPKAKTDVNWQAIAERYLLDVTPERRGEIISEFSSPRQDSPYLRAWWKK